MKRAFLLLIIFLVLGAFSIGNKANEENVAFADGNSIQIGSIVNIESIDSNNLFIVLDVDTLKVLCIQTGHEYKVNSLNKLTPAATNLDLYEVYSVYRGPIVDNYPMNVPDSHWVIIGDITDGWYRLVNINPIDGVIVQGWSIPPFMSLAEQQPQIVGQQLANLSNSHSIVVSGQNEAIIENVSQQTVADSQKSKFNFSEVFIVSIVTFLFVLSFVYKHYRSWSKDFGLAQRFVAKIWKKIKDRQQQKDTSFGEYNNRVSGQPSVAVQKLTIEIAAGTPRRDDLVFGFPDVMAFIQAIADGNQKVINDAIIVLEGIPDLFVQLQGQNTNFVQGITSMNNRSLSGVVNYALRHNVKTQIEWLKEVFSEASKK